ncbi:SHD1 domain-containing protein [Rosistilla oblonga]|uniref:SHD1 domain-containing protein n=1 Tax=Rosistilla oblonga TaxID=2527990 RepID=UPI003A972EFF
MLLKISIALLGCAAIAAASVPGRLLAEPLRYAPESGSRFAYRFEIGVDGDDETITYKGVTKYTVNAVKEDRVRLTYHGGLSESKKVKGRQGRGGRRFGPPSIPRPFSRPTFAGKVTTTNQITLSPQGEVLAMNGDSQLPYLLGNVSLMPFETLPEEETQAWTIDSGVSITKNEQNGRMGGRFGPLDPFGRGDNGPKDVRAAGEVTKYSITGEQDGRVQISKSYQLTMPANDKNQTYEMTGSGSWTFDRTAALPDAIDIQYKLVVNDGNTTVTVPIHVKYDRISGEELDRMEAEAKRIAEERAMAAKQAKEEAERPLSEEELAAAIADLQSGDDEKIQAQLEALAKKSVADPSPKVAAAIEAHIEHEDKKLRSAAHNALMRWAPDYKVVQDLKKAYGGFGTVKSTDREVDALTPLYVGQIVQFQEHGSFWFPGEIVSLNADKSVVVRRRAGSSRKVTVKRRNVQLAPEQLPQPNKPASVSAAPMAAEGTSPVRTWSDATGRFKIEANLLRVENGGAVLKRTDGREVTVPVTKLSAADQTYLKAWEAALNADNPFEP